MGLGSEHFGKIPGMPSLPAFLRVLTLLQGYYSLPSPNATVTLNPG